MNAKEKPNAVYLFWNEPIVKWCAKIEFPSSSPERMVFNSVELKTVDDYRQAVRAVAVMYGLVLDASEIAAGSVDGGWAQWRAA